MSLKVIDIKELNLDDHQRVGELVSQLVEACETSGFFYLKVDFAPLCAEMMEKMREIFSLPHEQKQKLACDATSQYRYRGKPIAGSGAGLRALGHDPNFTSDLRESYNITVPIFSDLEEARREADPFLNGNGRNKWPDPSSVSPQWRNVITEYADQCMKCCQVLARLFALALGQEMTFFEKPGLFDNPTCMLGMNYYHFPGAKLWEEGQPYGVKPHLDSGIFTLLLTDGSDGLERCVNRKAVDEVTATNERIWAPVTCPSPDQGLLVVNLGKNMDFWTGGRFKATLHRVVNKTGQTRYSVPFFYEPNIDARIEPIFNCQDAEKDAQMRAYIEQTFGRTFVVPADLYLERLAQRDNLNFDP